MTTNKTTPGLAAEVRREAEVAVARQRLIAYEQHWILSADEEIVFAANRTLENLNVEEGVKTYRYFFARLNGEWFGTGSTAPNNLSNEEMVNWLIDHDIDPFAITRYTPDNAQGGDVNVPEIQTS